MFMGQLMTIYYRGTAGNDRLKAESVFPFDKPVLMEGFGGHDELAGAFGHFNTIRGGAGNDTLSGGASGNLLDGGDGNDLIEVFWSSYSTLLGGAGSDVLIGGDGGNILNGGAGDDRMEGGEGADVYIVNSIRDVVVETYVPYYHNDPNPADRVESSVSWTLGVRLEHLTLTGARNIDGTGNALANVIIGNGGANRLSGGAGADRLNGGLGNDVLNGGAGVDTAVFDGLLATTVNLSRTAAQSTGHGSDTFLNIENVQSAAGNDALTGSAAANRLWSAAGNDRLSGLQGNDTLYGQTGNDVLDGGQGDDWLAGGAGADRFVFHADSGRDTIEDFTDTVDRIAVHSGAEAWSDIRITDQGRNALIEFGLADIVLLNFDHARLSAADFIFV